MKDQSIFEGFFENATLQDGSFKHFTGLEFQGKFKKDKFYQGKIFFVDGDILEGEWGNKRGKWVLKKGKLIDDEEKQKHLFDSQNGRFWDRNKEISSDGPFGFQISLAKYVDNLD